MRWSVYMADLLELRLHCDAERKVLMKRFMYNEIFSNPYNDPQWECSTQAGCNQAMLMETLTGEFSTVGGQKNIILFPERYNSQINHFHL